MKKLSSLLIFGLMLVISSSLTYAQKFEYPANQDKSFLSEDEFFQQLSKDTYEEFEDATYSVRRRISYKEVPKAIMTFEKKTGRYFGQPLDELASHIHPDRARYISLPRLFNQNVWKIGSTSLSMLKLKCNLKAVIVNIHMIIRIIKC